MKRIQDFLAAKGTVIMMVGFAIIAIDAAIFGYMVINGMVKPAVQSIMFYVVMVGFSIYMTGRIGVVLQRRKSRQDNEFAKDETDPGKNA